MKRGTAYAMVHCQSTPTTRRQRTRRTRTRQLVAANAPVPAPGNSSPANAPERQHFVAVRTPLEQPAGKHAELLVSTRSNEFSNRGSPWRRRAIVGEARPLRRRRVMAGHPRSCSRSRTRQRRSHAPSRTAPIDDRRDAPAGRQRERAHAGSTLTSRDRSSRCARSRARAACAGGVP